MKKALKRVLVVEDSPSVANTLLRMFRQLELEPVAASSLAEVKQLLEENSHFFLATLDYNLPDAPHGEILPIVIAHRIPSIVLTGKVDHHSRERILGFPIVDYIPKDTSQTMNYLRRLVCSLMTNHRKKILVVDDVASARNHVRTLLERHNYQVLEAEDGIQALKVLKQHPDIKLLITDNEMPNMDGLRLINQVRRQFSPDEMAIIGVSVGNADLYLARYIKNGANDYITKPFSQEEFYCRVFQNLEHIDNIERIKNAANHDFLTRLPNRRFFFDRLSNNGHAPQALAMLDIDHFKQINDNHGHSTGDKVLVQLAKRLEKHFPHALVARFGGEEFCIAFLNNDPWDALGQLEYLRHDIEVRPLHLDGGDIAITISIGLTASKGSIDDMLNQADKLLYQAKRQGRNLLLDDVPL